MYNKYSFVSHILTYVYIYEVVVVVEILLILFFYKDIFLAKEA